MTFSGSKRISKIRVLTWITWQLCEVVSGQVRSGISINVTLRLLAFKYLPIRLCQAVPEPHQSDHEFERETVIKEVTTVTIMCLIQNVRD